MSYQCIPQERGEGRGLRGADFVRRVNDHERQTTRKTRSITRRWTCRETYRRTPPPGTRFFRAEASGHSRNLCIARVYVAEGSRLRAYASNPLPQPTALLLQAAAPRQEPTALVRLRHLSCSLQHKCRSLREGCKDAALCVCATLCSVVHTPHSAVHTLHSAVRRIHTLRPRHTHSAVRRTPMPGNSWPRRSLIKPPSLHRRRTDNPHFEV